MKIKELVYNDFKLTDVETSAEELVQLLRMAEEETTLSEIEASVEKLVQLLRMAEEESTLIDMEELEQVVRSGEDQGELVQPCAKSKPIQEVLNEELHEFKVGDLVRLPTVVNEDEYEDVGFLDGMGRFFGRVGVVVKVYDSITLVEVDYERYWWLNTDLTLVVSRWQGRERFKAADYVRIHKDVDFDRYTWYPFMSPEMKTLLGFTGTVVRVSDETVTVMTHPESKTYEWLKEDVSHVFSRGDKVKISDYISEDYANWYKTYLPNREDYLGKVGEIKLSDLNECSYLVEIENKWLWFKGVHLEPLRKV